MLNIIMLLISQLINNNNHLRLYKKILLKKYEKEKIKYASNLIEIKKLTI